MTLLSTIHNLLSRVTQGSSIGPLIFLTYINDLVELLRKYNMTAKLFADDVKLYVKVVNTTDIDELQSALVALVQWAEDWQL